MNICMFNNLNLKLTSVYLSFRFYILIFKSFFSLLWFQGAPLMKQFPPGINKVFWLNDEIPPHISFSFYVSWSKIVSRIYQVWLLIHWFRFQILYLSQGGLQSASVHLAAGCIWDMYYRVGLQSQPSMLSREMVFFPIYIEQSRDDLNSCGEKALRTWNDGK